MDSLFCFDDPDHVCFDGDPWTLAIGPSDAPSYTAGTTLRVEVVTSKGALALTMDARASGGEHALSVTTPKPLPIGAYRWDARVTVPDGVIMFHGKLSVVARITRLRAEPTAGAALEDLKQISSSPTGAYPLPLADGTVSASGTVAPLPDAPPGWTRADLLAALAREDPQLYRPAPAADVEGLTLTELGLTLCARYGVEVGEDEHGLQYAVVE